MEYDINEVVQLKELILNEKYGKKTATIDVVKLSQQIIKIERVDQFQYGVRDSNGRMVFINDEMIEHQISTNISDDELYNIVKDWLRHGKTRQQIMEMVHQAIEKVIADKFKE